MRTHTTYTDLRVIMKHHANGMSVEEISNQMKIAMHSVQNVIDVRTKKKRTRKPKEPVTEDT